MDGFSKKYHDYLNNDNRCFLDTFKSLKENNIRQNSNHCQNPELINK